ncbi:MAG: hypothetical protein IJ943_08940 [Akkermansia sp.]|nr:hypothetical protein [Akkermansia sp.]
MKKLRKDSKFARLTEEQRGELALYLECNGLEDAQQWLAARGVEVSLQNISEYYRLHVLPYKWVRMETAAAVLSKVGGDKVTDAAHRAVAQRVFELSTDPKADPELLAKFYKLMNDGQATAQNERKLALLEAKARRADEAQAVAGDKTKSADERMQKIREIFGLN